MYEITKIITEGSITIHYDQINNNGIKRANYTMKSHEQPRPEFREAMTVLNQHVQELCELPENYFTRINPYQVDFEYDADGIMSAVIKADMQLFNSHGVLELKTPKKRVVEVSVNLPNKKNPLQMSEALEEDLEHLKNEAILYIQGERAQMSLLKGGAA